MLLVLNEGSLGIFFADASHDPRLKWFLVGRNLGVQFVFDLKGWKGKEEGAVISN